MNLELAGTIGNPIDRTRVGIQAGEALRVSLTLDNSENGHVSLRYWRHTPDFQTHTVRLVGSATSQYDLKLPTEVTRYLDGSYLWALWWEPTTGDEVCLMPASQLLVSTSGGFAPADPEYVTGTELAAAVSPLATKTELAAAKAAAVDDWSDWLSSDQSAVVGDYLDVVLPNKTENFLFELQMNLRTATGCGGYTRYRLVSAGVPASQASAVIGSYTETIYTQVVYSVVDISDVSYLRLTLSGGGRAITQKVISSRYRRI